MCIDVYDFYYRNIFYTVNKRQRIPKEQSKMDNPKKLAT